MERKRLGEKKTERLSFHFKVSQIVFVVVTLICWRLMEMTYQVYVGGSEWITSAFLVLFMLQLAVYLEILISRNARMIGIGSYGRLTAMVFIEGILGLYFLIEEGFSLRIWLGVAYWELKMTDFEILMYPNIVLLIGLAFLFFKARFRNKRLDFSRQHTESSKGGESE